MKPPNTTRTTATPTPWSYFFIRLLFKFVLKVFYGSIVVENAELIPGNGEACIICANHSNSLTDALLLVTSVPSKTRNLLRLTAKATLFGKKNFTSWLIESAGTVPIQRKKDNADGSADNSQVMLGLMQALEKGDAVALFPEGISRYHPTLAPLKTGVARLVADVLSRNRDDPQFRISVLTCSITYMHREHFRSDVLITFHPPMVFSPETHPKLLEPVDFTEVREITNKMQKQISFGMLDSPSWDIIRTSKLAAQIYAPLGTTMSLGDYVRVCRTFIEVFKWAEDENKGSLGTHSDTEEGESVAKDRMEYIMTARRILKEYQDDLSRLGITDGRIRKRLSTTKIIKRICIRFQWFTFLAFISFPGVLLWIPIFLTTYTAIERFKKTGPVVDIWDDISQLKLIYGLFSGLGVVGICMLFTLPIAPITAIIIPALMWISLRWFEDATSACRALVELNRLLFIPSSTPARLSERRRTLREMTLRIAAEYLGLPDAPEEYFKNRGGNEKGRVRGLWESRAKYFSIRRRRKRNWNETLRLYDMVDYPEDPQL